MKTWLAKLIAPYFHKSYSYIHPHPISTHWSNDDIKDTAASIPSSQQTAAQPKPTATSILASPTSRFVCRPKYSTVHSAIPIFFIFSWSDDSSLLLVVIVFAPNCHNLIFNLYAQGPHVMHPTSVQSCTKLSTFIRIVITLIIVTK